MIGSATGFGHPFTWRHLSDLMQPNQALSQDIMAACRQGMRDSRSFLLLMAETLKGTLQSIESQVAGLDALTAQGNESGWTNLIDQRFFSGAEGPGALWAKTIWMLPKYVLLAQAEILKGNLAMVNEILKTLDNIASSNVAASQQGPEKIPVD